MMEGLSLATNQTDKSWKTGLFRRRRSFPQLKASFIKRSSNSTLVQEDDTLNSDTASDPFFQYTINDDCSYSVIDVPPDKSSPLPLGQDQLVVSTNSPIQPDTPLHHPESPEQVVSLIQLGYDPNQRDSSLDAMCPIHSIVRTRSPNQSQCLEALLVYSEVNVNLCAAHAMSALHFAAMNGDMRCVKLLLTFGADINLVSEFDQTPMNIAVAHDKENIINLLEALRGITAAFVEPSLCHPLPVIFRPCYMKQQYLPLSPCSSDNELELGTRVNVFGGNTPIESLRINDRSVLSQFHLQNLFKFNEDDITSLASQEQPFYHNHIQHLTHVLSFKVHNGHRILTLDGGWMRTLVQLDALEQLEIFTGQKVTDMFDILVGSSSAALVVLGLVYGDSTLSSLRQMFFRMKNSLFSNSQDDLPNNSAMLKNFIQAIIGRDLKMSDISYPKVMIPAVYREANVLQLKFFTNFANDVYSLENVFNVALSATATPFWFSPNAQFIDASVVANNPTDYALSYLQSHYYLARQHFPVSLLVSLGAGVYPSRDKVKGVEPPVKPTEDAIGIKNLTTITKQSIVQSDTVATHCALRCQEIGIKYFRLNPTLKETVSITEIDTRKLINMVLRSRIEMYMGAGGIEALKKYFLKLSELHNAQGGGLPGYDSGATSPGGLLIRSSSGTSSSDEGITVKQKRQY